MQRKDSQPANRFGVHFEHQDLCARLRELQAGATVKVLSRGNSRVPSQKKRVFLSTYTKFKKPQEQRKAAGVQPTISLLKASKWLLNRSFTPCKLHSQKALDASLSQAPVKLPVRHRRQASLPSFLAPIPHKVISKPHRKSKSVYPNVDL